MRTSATYLYCLVRTPGTLASEGAPPGLPGLSDPRALAVGDSLWLVAADAPLPEYGSASIQENLQNLDWVSSRAMAHEAVVEHFGKIGTVVPMKLFTLFAGDDRALEHVRSERGRLDRILDRIAGCQEWGVLVRFDEAKAKEVAAEEARQGAGAKSAGTAFLLRKKMEQEASRTLLARLRGEMDEVFSDLEAQAAEARRREPVSPSPLLLDGAFLVRSAQAAGFEKTVDRWAKRLSEQACEVTLTGPWPPYNFIGGEAS
ncbi:MAG: GvpL/GvpF family gas vesicle protein [Thermoanaerobaculia bacterium]